MASKTGVDGRLKYFHITRINTMKAILTLVFVLIFGATSMARPNFASDEKVNSYAVDLVLDCSANGIIADEKTVIPEKRVVRVYRLKNSRVKKALSFATKKSKPKLA